MYVYVSLYIYVYMYSCGSTIALESLQLERFNCNLCLCNDFLAKAIWCYLGLSLTIVNSAYYA